MKTSNRYGNENINIVETDLLVKRESTQVVKDIVKGNSSSKILSIEIVSKFGRQDRLNNNSLNVL